jgi:hypothetical protein
MRSWQRMIIYSSNRVAYGSNPTKTVELPDQVTRTIPDAATRSLAGRMGDGYPRA